MKNTLLKSLAAVAILAVTATGAAAQSAKDFYKGKTVEIYIGYGLGGTYGKSATITVLIIRFVSRESLRCVFPPVTVPGENRKLSIPS